MPALNRLHHHRVVTCLPIPQLSWVLLASVLAAACSSTGGPTESSRDRSNQAAWFCQTGEDTAAWECVQDAELAATPNPVRSPPKQEAPAPQRAVPPPPTGPLTSTFEPAQQAQPIAPTPQPRPEQAASDAQLPKHVRLAYRPERPTAMLDLPDDFWAVQLIALSDREALEKYVREQDLRGMSAARIEANEQLMYILLLGIYETYDLAAEASEDLPAPFNQPWIRPMSGLKRAMVAGEILAEELGEAPIR